MPTNFQSNSEMDSGSKLRIPADTMLVKRGMRSDEVALSDFDRDAVDLARLGKKQVLEVRDSTPLQFQTSFIVS